MPRKRVESASLWIWAVIVTAIIAAKFTVRWSTLKRLAKVFEKNGR